jgi:hypothetical protein
MRNAIPARISLQKDKSVNSLPPKKSQNPMNHGVFYTGTFAAKHFPDELVYERKNERK